MAKIKIMSDGTSTGTRVLVDGEELEGVVNIAWAIASPGLSKAIITFDHVQADVEVEETDVSAE